MRGFQTAPATQPLASGPYRDLQLGNENDDEASTRPAKSVTKEDAAPDVRARGGAGTVEHGDFLFLSARSIGRRVCLPG